jgi:hypothetical protein
VARYLQVLVKRGRIIHAVEERSDDVACGKDLEIKRFLYANGDDMEFPAVHSHELHEKFCQKCGKIVHEDKLRSSS